MKTQSFTNMFRKHLPKDRTQQRIANLQSHAGAPHQPPLSPKSLLQIPPSWFLCGCCVSHPGAQDYPISHTQGREPGKGHTACELVGSVPRCPSSGAAISFVSYEDGKEEKNSPLAFVLNSDQLLTSIVPLPHFYSFYPHKAHSWAPSSKSHMSVTWISLFPLEQTTNSALSSGEVKPWKAEFTSGSL